MYGRRLIRKRGTFKCEAMKVERISSGGARWKRREVRDWQWKRERGCRSHGRVMRNANCKSTSEVLAGWLVHRGWCVVASDCGLSMRRPAACRPCSQSMTCVVDWHPWYDIKFPTSVAASLPFVFLPSRRHRHLAWPLLSLFVLFLLSIMAPRVQLRTNRHQARSYREQSFDDDLSDENFMQSDNIDTDDDDASSSSRQPSPQPRAARERHSARNRGQPKVSYKEDSDHEAAESQHAHTDTSQLPSRKRTRTAKPASKASTPRKKQKVPSGFAKRRPNTQGPATSSESPTFKLTVLL